VGYAIVLVLSLAVGAVVYALSVRGEIAVLVSETVGEALGETAEPEDEVAPGGGIPLTEEEPDGSWVTGALGLVAAVLVGAVALAAALVGLGRALVRLVGGLAGG
jgi:hypothetical protein